METTLATLNEQPDTRVVVRVGTEHWDQGLVTLAVHGSGLVEVQQRRAGKERSWTAQRDADEIAAFGALIARHRFTAARASKLPREPGDTPLRLAVFEGERERFAVDIWDGDRYSDRDLDAILRASDKLCHSVSGGEVGYP